MLSQSSQIRSHRLFASDFPLLQSLLQYLEKRFSQKQMNSVMKENGSKKHCFPSGDNVAPYSPMSSLLLTKKKLLLVATISIVMLPFSYANATPAVNSNPVINSASTKVESEDILKDNMPASLFGVGKAPRRNSEDTAAFIVKANEEDVEIMKSVERKVSLYNLKKVVSQRRAKNQYL